jgi:carboxypeptidase Q
MRSLRKAAFLVLIPCLVVSCRGLAADPALEQIRQEAFNRSRVMDHAFYLSDVHGPRFIASPAFEQATQWVISRLKEMGIEDVRTEGIGQVEEQGFRWSQRGWSYSRFALEIVEPQYRLLTAIPVPFSPGTPGKVSGQPIRCDLPPPSEAELNQFFDKYRGKLKGRFLLVTPALPVSASVDGSVQRYSAAELTELATPVPPLPVPPSSGAASNVNRSRPNIFTIAKNYNRLFQFLRDEGVLGILRAAAGGSGNMYTSSPMGLPDPDPPPPPDIDVIPEQYNRIVRLSEHGIPATIQLELQSTLHEPRELSNVIADLPGAIRKDEIVLVGAHLDSWHGGTGATDNAAGVAVVMEAMRILKSLNLPMARTVRAAFWSAEEMGTRGSKAYVATHAAELQQITCYINLDHGSGRIRGAYFSNDPIRERLIRWLNPVHDLDATTLSPRITTGSDQRNFIAANVPSANLLQDRLRYETLTHHSTMDVYDYLSEDDLKQAAAVVATLLYEAAQDTIPASAGGK